MSTVLVVIAAVIALAIVVILIVAASKPNAFRMERSAVVKAPPEKILPFMTDFRRWRAWSPWEKLDADLKRDFGGADSGKGATYAWQGRKAGSGRMEIMEATPSRLLIKLDFLKPFEAHNTAEFTLLREGNGTRVNWAMYGPQPFVAKLMGTVINTDKLIGKDFEKGLAALKANAEA
jgi:hypothetical protein